MLGDDVETNQNVAIKMVRIGWQ